jgi:hypothetical protein
VPHFFGALDGAQAALFAIHEAAHRIIRGVRDRIQQVLAQVVREEVASYVRQVLGSKSR